MLRVWSRLAVFWLVVAAFASGVAVSYNLRLLEIVHRATDLPGSVSLASAQAAADGAVAANYALLASLLPTGVSFMWWMFAAMRAARRVNERATRRTPRWAFWSWLIPVVNLFEPKAIVNDLWDASSSRVTRRPILLNIWWTMWLVGLALDRLVAAVASGGLSASRRTLTLAVAGQAVQTCDAILAVAVVLLLTRRLLSTAATRTAAVAAPPSGLAPTAPSPVAANVFEPAEADDAELDAKWRRFVQQADH